MVSSLELAFGATQEYPWQEDKVICQGDHAVVDVERDVPDEKNKKKERIEREDFLFGLTQKTRVLWKTFQNKIDAERYYWKLSSHSGVPSITIIMTEIFTCLRIALPNRNLECVRSLLNMCSTTLRKSTYNDVPRPPTKQMVCIPYPITIDEYGRRYIWIIWLSVPSP